MTNEQIVLKLKEFLNSSYPNMKIEVKEWEDDTSRIAVSFTDEKFKLLYPEQRYHYIRHLIPESFFKKFLANSVWFELAPGEDKKKLRYLDEEYIAGVEPFIVKALEKIEFFKKLDNQMLPLNPFKKAKKCQGDFTLTKSILIKNNFKENEIFDICHMLMSKGGYCDCEVLYNVADVSKFRKKYWKKRLKEIEKNHN
jgi:hypothetical protein